jgi:chromatin remodeling complex protein RSC6
MATKAPAKAASKDASKPAAKRQPNAAFMKPLVPSPELAQVIGAEPLPRTEATKKIWDYIKQHSLQDAQNKRNINADSKLEPIFKKKQITMFEMTKLVSEHLKAA